MLYLFRLLLLLIHIDQETVLNWFGIENAINQDFNFNQSNFETSTDVSLTTFRLILESLWKKVQDGLSFGDIENILFFILFIRFVILAIRYNLKTSVYITCIGLVAGFLWYRHLVDIIFMYRILILKIPFVHKLGPDMSYSHMRHLQINMNLNKQVNPTDFTGDLTDSLTTLKSDFKRSSGLKYEIKGRMMMPKRNFKKDLELIENVHWYNIGKTVYSAIKKALVHTQRGDNIETSYYIDPISMIISNLPESIKLKILPIHFSLYHNIIPNICSIFSKFWNQLSGVASYAFITRIGKRYCPYLVRWHWTSLVILGLVEQPFLYFLGRVCYFNAAVLRPRSIINPDIVSEVKLLETLVACMVLAHIGVIILGLFHAIWGQYFYVPFFVENIELHIGLRPTDSVYSGGQTSWQNKNEKEKNLNRFLPKVWYGWFGRGNKNDLQFITNISKFLKKMIKKLRRQFQK